MGFDTTKFAVGAGECLYAPRTARATVQVKAATTPTTTAFTVVTAEKAKIRVGDILMAAGSTPVNTPAEASASPRIISIEASGSDWLVTVSPAFGVAPAASAQLVIAWHDLGATKGDIEAEIETETEDIEIDQSLDIVACILKGRKVSFMFPFAEASYTQVAMAAGVTLPAVGATSLDIGQAAAGAANENRFLALLPAPGGLKRWTVMHRGVTKGKASLKASKTDIGVIECRVLAMPDSGVATSTNVVQFKDA